MKLKNGEVVSFTTDKSGKMCIDNPENYIRCMQPHIEEAREVTENEYYEIERMMNSHMNSWCNIIRVDERVRSAMQATNN